MGIDVAAVHEAVDANGLDAALGSHGDQGLAVRLHGVDAAGAHETHEVQGLTGSGDIVHGLGEDLVGLDGAVLDGVVDAGELLEHDAAGTDVEVAHLGIAHLAVGKADVLAGSTQRGVGILLVQRVDERGARSCDGVVRALGRQAEAVHDDEQRRKMMVSHI